MVAVGLGALALLAAIGAFWGFRQAGEQRVVAEAQRVVAGSAASAAGTAEAESTRAEARIEAEGERDRADAARAEAEDQRRRARQRSRSVAPLRPGPWPTSVLPQPEKRTRLPLRQPRCMRLGLLGRVNSQPKRSVRRSKPT